MLPSTRRATAELRARFKLEATVTADIESEHIVETFDAGVDEETGAPFLVMELLRGEELGALLDERGPFSPAEAVVLLDQAALALDKTHAAGIVHRDLKPENLFVTRRDDGAPRLKILDFGIAKVVAEQRRRRTHADPRHAALHGAGADPGDAGIGGAPTSTRSATSPTRCSSARRTGRRTPSKRKPCTPSSAACSSGRESAPSERAPRRRGVTLPRTLDRWFLHATALESGDALRERTVLVAALTGALAVPADARASLVDVAGGARASSQPPRLDKGSDSVPDPKQSGPHGTARLSDGPRSSSPSGSPSVPRVEREHPDARRRGSPVIWCSAEPERCMAGYCGGRGAPAGRRRRRRPSWPFARRIHLRGHAHGVGGEGSGRARNGFEPGAAVADRRRSPP